MERAALLIAIIDNAIDGIITITDLGVVESINPSACKLFGYEPNQVVGNNIVMLMPPPDCNQHNKYILRYKYTGQAHIIGIGREVQGRRQA